MILGYPRSGTHLLCYSLSQILDSYVIANPQSDQWRRIRMYPKNAYASSTFPPYLKKTDQIPPNSLFFSHNPNYLGLSKANQKKDYLIVIIRDYHECFARNYGRENPNLNKQLAQECQTKITSIFDDSTWNYPNILRCYDEWNPQMRILIRYEDLTANFESVIKNLLVKLKITDHHLNAFIGNFEGEMKNSSKIYQIGQGGSQSGGDPKYYQKNTLSKNDLYNMDHTLKTHNPHLWKTYLSQYEIREEN